MPEVKTVNPSRLKAIISSRRLEIKDLPRRSRVKGTRVIRSGKKLNTVRLRLLPDKALRVLIVLSSSSELKCRVEKPCSA